MFLLSECLCLAGFFDWAAEVTLRHLHTRTALLGRLFRADLGSSPSIGVRSGPAARVDRRLLVKALAGRWVAPLLWWTTAKRRKQT